MEQDWSALAVAYRGPVRHWTMRLTPVNAINAELLSAFEAALAGDPELAAACDLRFCARAQALEFAREVADKAGRIGVSCAKQAIFGAGELPLSSALPLDSALHWDTMRRGNFLAGVEAFAKRYASGAAR